MATFHPLDGSQPVPYILCSRCAKRINGNLDQETMKRIETYISDCRQST